jgi:hypothetical protein
MSNMKSISLKFLALIILGIVAVTSCKKDDNELNSGPGKILTTGTISVPLNIDQTGWKIVSGMNTGTISKGNFKIYLNENAVQLVTVYDRNDKPVVISLNVTYSQTSNNTISAESTAEAMVFLNPFFCTSELTEAVALKQKIKTLASFSSLVRAISSELEKGSFSISEANVNFADALNLVYKDFTSQFNVKKSLIEAAPSDFDPYPDFEVNGLKLIDVVKTGTDLSFKVSNNAKRWISVYVDKSSDGTTFTRSASSVDIIPSPNISVWNIISQKKFFPYEYSNQIKTSTSGYKSISVKCYGLGVHNLLNNLADDEINRAIRPAVMSAFFDLTVPVLEVISGMKLELRGRPSNNAGWKLVDKIISKFSSDMVLKARFITWSREGDIVKILVEISKGVFMACMDEPALVLQLITEKAGQQAALSIVKNWLWPIKVINGCITAANIGFSLGSILATEAITNFKFDNSTATLPVTVKGNVKSFSTSAPVSGASVTSYDINGNLQQGAITDASGYYTFSSGTGYLKIRVVAKGYKPANQVLQIPADVVNQTPPNYYVATSWLSVYSGDPGNVSGFVKDATNLNPVSGVTILLRAGTNDLSREIIQQVISGSNGSFSFTSIPSGTYTAFFSKTGYISDFMVLSVLGGQSTTGFNMNLSPDIRTTSGYRIILTWGQNPEDLDSHIFTPLINGTKYHVYYYSKGSLINPPYVNLDVDKVTSYGPETITIAKTFAGEYFYSVNHYYGSGSLTTTSNATVNLYGVNGFIRSWTVPTTGSGLWWNVFSINGLTGNVTNINQISSAPPSGYKGMAEMDMKNKK